MFNTLLKYKIITILPFENSFYYTSALSNKIRLSKELISINYSKYSPFINPNQVHLFRDNQLFLWFYAYNIKSPIIIPESYLAYSELKKKNEDAIYIIHDTIYKILVIKDSILKSIFTLESLDENILHLSMDEYKISKKTYVSQKEYRTIIKKSQKFLKYKDFFVFSQFDLDRKLVGKYFIEKFSYPLAVLVVFAIMVSYIQGKTLQLQIEKLKKEYQIEKQKNNSIKKYISKHNKEVKLYKKFVKSELKFVEPMALLEEVYNIFDEGDKSYINIFRINGTNLELHVKMNENPIKYLNKLNKIKNFKKVILKRTIKPTKGFKTIIYDIEVKLLQDG